MSRRIFTSGLRPRTQHRTLVGMWCLLTIVVAVNPSIAQDRPPVDVDAQQRQAIIDTVVSELNACYIDPDVAVEIERKLRAEWEAGNYARYRELVPFLRKLREDMRLVTPDRHLGVWPIWFAPTPVDTSADALQKWRDKQRRDHHGFRRVEVLSGNVGYLELTRFADPAIGEPVALAAMEFLAGVDALIIDVRQNHGGSEHMVNLICGHLFAEPVHTISFYTRYKNETLDLWTPERALGSGLADVPVYVLQSGQSASAAEHMSYALQVVGRAVIVGEQSRGAANPVEERVYPSLSINISLPVSRATHPVTGTCWEGVGVQPDVTVAADDAVSTAHRLALELFANAASQREQ